jgi:hypothetical protein
MFANFSVELLYNPYCENYDCGIQHDRHTCRHKQQSRIRLLTASVHGTIFHTSRLCFFAWRCSVIEILPPLAIERIELCTVHFITVVFSKLATR